MSNNSGHEDSFIEYFFFQNITCLNYSLWKPYHLHWLVYWICLYDNLWNLSQGNVLASPWGRLFLKLSVCLTEFWKNAKYPLPFYNPLVLAESSYCILSFHLQILNICHPYEWIQDWTPCYWITILEALIIS